MDIIAIDGMIEQDFRNSVEDMLRLDQVDAAVERLQALVEPFCGPNGILPPCFATAARRSVRIGGWSRLGDRLRDHDRPQRAITAIGVTLADPTKLGGPGPSRGRLAPFIKTFYFSDEAYPFSGATRDDLLDGYSRDGFEWQGDYQATDVTLTVQGLEDLYGPIFTLERQLLARTDPDPEEIRAGTIGACFVAVLIHRALRDTIASQGLPRPLCVIAACDGVYPLFDAPVVGIEAGDAEPQAAEEEGGEIAVEGSLLNLISRRHDKAPVMTLCAEDVEEELRFGEIAASQTLDASAEHRPAGSLDLSQFDIGEAGDDLDPWEDPEAWVNRPPPAGWAPPMPPKRDILFPEGDFGLTLADPVEDASLDEEPTPSLAAVDPDERSHWLDEPVENLEATGEDIPADPLPARASHSLRAKIIATPVDADRSNSSWLGVAVAWFRRALLRR